MTLSTPVKIVALAGLALILGAGALLLLVQRPGTQAPAAAAATVAAIRVTPHAAPVAPKPKPRPKVHLDPRLPAPVAARLHLSREVVAFVYTGASAGDRALLQQVRDGAHAAGVSVVPLNVQDEPVAAAVYGWTSSTADPVAMVVRRPGTVVFTLPGLIDSATVQQAAAAAR